MKTTTAAARAEQILLALLEHGTAEKAAAALDISAATVWRWLRKPAFQARYRAARHQAYSHAMGRMMHAAPSAVATLRTIMHDPKEPAKIQLRAAIAILQPGRAPVEDLLARAGALRSADDSSTCPPKPVASDSLKIVGEGTPWQTSSAAEKTERIIAALLERGSHRAVATHLGISVTTVWRWLQRPQSQEGYARARGEAYSRAMVSAQQTANAAVSTVLSIMLNKATPTAVKIQASRFVLECAAEAGAEDVLAIVEREEIAKEERAA